MSIKDFQVDVGISIDGTTIDVSSNASSGGLVYDSTSSSFVSSVGNIPVGVVRLWASSSVGASPPEDYLICDGRQDLDQDDYASLYAIIGDRFTSSPNGSTFGLPSFNNTTTGTYPIAIGHDKTGDLNTPQVKPTPTTKSIGVSASTAHSHTSGSSFATTAQSSTTPSHAHVLNNVSSNHNHNYLTNTNGAHSHSTTNVSATHGHLYQAGGTNAQTSDANSNHNHTGYGPKQEHNHGNVSTSDAHGHGNTTARVNSAGITDDHSHNVSVSLAAVTANHNHTMNSSGFYFIIRYR
jgi:hypothetical protein